MKGLNILFWVCVTGVALSLVMIIYTGQQEKSNKTVNPLQEEVPVPVQ